MAAAPRVFVHAPTPALTDVVARAAAAAIGAAHRDPAADAAAPAAGVRRLPVDAGSWVRSWEQLAGDIEDPEDYDVLLCAADGAADAGVVASAAHALFRKRCPVLLMSRGDGTEAQLSAALSADTQPLLDLQQWANEEEISAAVNRFLTPPEQPGRIFTIEGGDGAGKETQTRMLVERLGREGYPVKTLDFPRDCAKYGKEVRVLLSGKHGSISEVGPLLFSTLYAMNRHDQRPVLRHWLRRGYNVVLDRYMESNFGHQAAKIDDEAERRKMISSLQAYECRWLGMPESSRVVYLDLDPEAALRAMQGDASRAKLDIHETARAGYKQAVRQCFRWCCDAFGTWDAVSCCSGDGAAMQRVSRDDVHGGIWGAWQADFVNRHAAMP